MKDSSTSARREAFWIVGIWLVFATWVIGYAAWGAYPEDPSSMTLTLGFPTWVVWGIAVPWVMASCVTIVFCLVGMEDTGE